MSVIIKLYLKFTDMKKNWLYYVLTVVKYAVTAALGYFGGTEIF